MEALKTPSASLQRALLKAQPLPKIQITENPIVTSNVIPEGTMQLKTEPGSFNYKAVGIILGITAVIIVIVVARNIYVKQRENAEKVNKEPITPVDSANEINNQPGISSEATAQDIFKPF